jgi:hypothetical protein
MKTIRFPCGAIVLLSLASLLSGCAFGEYSTSPNLESTVQALLTQVSSQSTEIAQHLEYVSYLATRVPPLQPSPAVRPLPTPFVVGSLFINDGKCCIGAVAGQPILIPVVFQAASPAAEVTDMRARAGSVSFNESQLSETEWEPFSPAKDFSYIAPINWSGFYVTVQFRDALGNLSPVYSSEISVEGMPAPPTIPAP